MSPLWRDEVCIDLGPRRFAMTRYSRGLKARTVTECSGTLPADVPGDWSPALAEVRAQFDRAQWQGVIARVVVADQWVRYAIVPWRRELSGDEERLAHGRLVLCQVYGDDMSGWTLQLGRTAPGLPRLVCAVPTRLLTDVATTLQGRAVRLVSIRPRLVAAFDRWRDRMPRSGAWFVTVDDDCLAAAKLDGPAWSAVHRIRVGRDWATDLARLRNVDRLSQGGQAEAGRILVDAPPRLRTGGAALRRELEWLDVDHTASPAFRRSGRNRGDSG